MKLKILIWIVIIGLIALAIELYIIHVCSINQFN